MEPTVPDQPWTTINNSCKTGRRTLKWWKGCSAARFSLSLAIALSKCMRCAQELEVSYRSQCLSNPSYSLCRFLVSYRSQCLGNPSYSLCQILFYEPRWWGCAGRQCPRIDQASDQSKSSCPALHRPWNSRFSENQRAHKLFGDTTPRNEESKNVSTELSKGVWPKEKGNRNWRRSCVYEEKL